MITLTILEGIGGFIAFCLFGTFVVFLLQGVSNLFNVKIVSRHGGNTIVEPTRKKKVHISPLEKLEAYNNDLFIKLTKNTVSEEEKLTIILNLDRIIFSHDDTLELINTFVDLDFFNKTNQQIPKSQKTAQNQKFQNPKHEKSFKNKDDDLPF